MSRTLMISLAAVAVAVLLAVFVIVPLLFSDSDADELPDPAQAGQSLDASDGGAEGHDELADDELADDGELEEESASEPVDETFEVFSARDPFQQLVTDEQAASAASDGDSVEDGGETAGEDGIIDLDEDPESGGDEADPDAADGGEPDPPEDASVGGTTVSLVEVFEDDDGEQAVQVLVNDTGYEAVVKQDFAKRFRVLEIDGSCATFLFGDQRFTLCEGESIRK